MEYCVDLNPRKHGTFVGGSGQKIVAPQFLVDYRPTVVILLNPMYEREIRAALDELCIPATILGPQGGILGSVISAQDNARAARAPGASLRRQPAVWQRQPSGAANGASLRVSAGK